MFEHVKNFFKHSAIYGASGLLTKLVALVLVPLYVRYLTPSDYGYLEIFVITASFLLQIIQLGMGAAIFRSIIYKPNPDKPLLISNAFYFLIVSSLLNCGLLFILADHISQLLFATEDAGRLLRIVFASLFLNSFSTVPLAYLRINNQSVKFSLIAIFDFLVDLSLNVFFVVVLRWGIEGILTAGLIKSAIFAFVYISIIRKSIERRFSFSELKDMLSFGLPLVPAGIALTILTISNRYFLKYYCTLSEVGFFSLGYRIGMIMALIVNAFQIAWPSILFSIARDEQAKRTYAKIFTLYLSIIFFIGLGISVFAPEIVGILATESYRSAAGVVPLIVLSYVFMGIYYLTAVGINLLKKTQYEPLIVGTAAVLNLFLNYLLIPRYRIIGAAIASVLSFMTLALLEWRVSTYFYPIRYEHSKLLKLLAVSALIYGSSFMVSFDHFIYSITFKCALLIIFPVMLFYTGFFEPSEILKLKAVIKYQFNGRLRGMS